MSPFEPPRALRNRHLQSVLASSQLRRLRVLHQGAVLSAHTHDVVVPCGDGIRLLVHHSPPRKAGLGTVVVLIHGWEGSGTSTYMIAAAARLWEAGHRVIRINLRDHGDSHHLNAELFHSCRLDEVIGAVKWVQAEFPNETLCLGGYSLGGNFSLRIAARSHEVGLTIDRVVAVCPVLDPEQTMVALDTGWVGYRLYFIRKWRRSLHRKQAAWPELYDFARLERFRTLESMTDHFVQHYTEFPDLRAYLRGYAITGNRLASMRVSARVLLADDDPVIPVTGVEGIARSPTLRIERSAFGGHCGFLRTIGLQSWLDDYLLQAISPNPGSRRSIG